MKLEKGEARRGVYRNVLPKILLAGCLAASPGISESAWAAASLDVFDPDPQTPAAAGDSQSGWQESPPPAGRQGDTNDSRSEPQNRAPQPVAHSSAYSEPPPPPESPAGSTYGSHPQAAPPSPDGPSEPDLESTAAASSSAGDGPIPPHAEPQTAALPGLASPSAAPLNGIPANDQGLEAGPAESVNTEFEAISNRSPESLPLALGIIAALLAMRLAARPARRAAHR